MSLPTEEQVIELLRDSLEILQSAHTPEYSAPEQLDRPRFDNDIYSVGLIAIQFLTGLHPRKLRVDPTGEIIWNYSLPDRPQPLVSDGLRSILDKMVRYHFNDRYQSAADVLRDLDDLALPPSSDSPSEDI